MAALGLAAYSSSDEDEDSGKEVAQTAPTTQPLAAPAHSTAPRTGGAGTNVISHLVYLWRF